MDYAIIKSGSSGLLKVIKLTDWFDYEWDDFATVKERDTGEIKWFYTEEEAIEFMVDNFPRTMIEEDYFKTTSFDGKYYVD